jgi:nucleotide-binding universal stress UspA family protein
MALTTYHSSLLTMIPPVSKSTRPESGDTQSTTRIHVYGPQNEAFDAVLQNVEKALEAFPMRHRLTAISDPGKLKECGIKAFPALSMDGMTMSEGEVPDVKIIVEMLRNRYLYHSKLYRLKTILVPVDMSDISENALYFAWQMAEKTGSSIRVLNVIETAFEGQYAAPEISATHLKKSMQRELDDFTRKTLKMLDVDWKGNPPNDVPHSGPGPQLNTITEFGFPDLVIEEHARKSDLMVMGMKGRGASLSDRLFGSVSSEMLQHASCPILFIPPTAAFRNFKSMMYASSFASLDNLRIRQVVSFAQRFNSQMHFVHITQPQEKNEEIQERLFELNYRDAAGEQPFIFSTIDGEDGIIQSLREYAFHHRIELMVFVTQQRTFWNNLLHNSVTRQALYSSDIPFLVIHADSDLF